MSERDGIVVDENKQYSMVLSEDKKTILFDWKFVAGLGAGDFRAGIIEFAGRCKKHRPTRAVISAAALDQGSPAVAWLRSQNVDADEEEYGAWWAREIVPLYHEAGITSLAVATGDPSAPGEVADSAPQIRFKMGYFPDLETALSWQAA